MRGKQHILRGGGCRHDLLNHRDFGVSAHCGHHDDNERGPQRLVMLRLQRTLAQIFFTALERLCQDIPEAVTSITPDEEEAPRPQPAVVRRPNSRRENLIKIGIRRTGLNNAKRGDAANQGGEYRRFTMFRILSFQHSTTSLATSRYGRQAVSPTRPPSLTTASSTTVPLKKSGFMEVYIRAALLKTNLRKSAFSTMSCSTSS